MTRIIRVLILLIFLALTSGQMLAQVQTGTPPFGSFAGGPDVINLANLNSHLTIPVLHKAGRGTDFTYDLSYDSSVWYSTLVNGVQTWQPVGGWRGVTEVTTGYITYKAHRYQCPVRGDGFYVIYDTFVYHDMFGQAHGYVGSSEIDCNSFFTGFWEAAADGSGYAIDVTDVASADVTSPAGTVYNPPLNLTSGAANFLDRNGN